MNKVRDEAKAFGVQSVELLKLASAHNIDIGIAPTFTAFCPLRKTNPDLILAAQNCHHKDHGAFTGEISIPMIKDFGITWCLVGHSERRTYFAETNNTCNEKLKALIANDMTAIYCVGETLAQYEAGETKKVIYAQIVEGLKDLSAEDVKHVVVAYEPVWSIGTGKNASVEIAQDICAYIRSLIKEAYGEVAEEIRILYGGSVKPENVRAYMSAADVDGALVGGASLEVDSFKKLIENCI